MKDGKLSLMGVDLAGGALTALLLAWGAWTSLASSGEGVQTAKNLHAQIATAKTDLASLQTSLESQIAQEGKYRAELASAGAMPAPSPQETHLKVLSSLAAQNHLSVVRQLPLAPREYPGLLEQRFAYEVTGAMADLARFFKAVEASPGWTDIGYLKLEQGQRESSAERTALLTFSAFSLPGRSPASGSQGG